MAISAKHHYVPKAILRNFCFQGESIYYYSKRTPDKGIKKRNINTIFTKRHLNSFENKEGIKNDGLEKFFAYNFDNEINRWVAKFEQLPSKGRVEFSTVQDRYLFIQFFYNHMKRTPDLHQPVVDDIERKFSFESSINEFSSKYGPLNDNELNMISDPSFRERVMNNSRVEALGKQDIYILDKLSACTIHLATPKKSNKQFSIGSNPVVRFKGNSRQNLGDAGVEFWTPLTPRLAVGLVMTTRKSGTIELETEQVRNFNVTLAKNSISMASKSKHLLSSLKTF